MSKTDKTKPYDVRLREEGGVPYRDIFDKGLTQAERDSLYDRQPGQHLLRAPALITGEGSPAARRFAKRLRNKRIRKSEHPNLHRPWGGSW